MYEESERRERKKNNDTENGITVVQRQETYTHIRRKEHIYLSISNAIHRFPFPFSLIFHHFGWHGFRHNVVYVCECVYCHYEEVDTIRNLFRLNAE